MFEDFKPFLFVDPYEIGLVCDFDFKLQTEDGIDLITEDNQNLYLDGDIGCNITGFDYSLRTEDNIELLIEDNLRIYV